MSLQSYFLISTEKAENRNSFPKQFTILRKKQEIVSIFPAVSFIFFGDRHKEVHAWLDIPGNQETTFNFGDDLKAKQVLKIAPGIN